MSQKQHKNKVLEVDSVVIDARRLFLGMKPKPRKKGRAVTLDINKPKLGSGGKL